MTQTGGQTHKESYYLIAFNNASWLTINKLCAAMLNFYLYINFQNRDDSFRFSEADAREKHMGLGTNVS